MHFRLEQFISMPLASTVEAALPVPLFSTQSFNQNLEYLYINYSSSAANRVHENDRWTTGHWTFIFFIILFLSFRTFVILPLQRNLQGLFCMIQQTCHNTRTFMAYKTIFLGGFHSYAVV